MPKHCAEFRNEPQSVNMQRNIRHIWGGHDALPSSRPTFLGDVSPCPRRIYATAWALCLGLCFYCWCW